MLNSLQLLYVGADLDQRPRLPNAVLFVLLLYLERIITMILEELLLILQHLSTQGGARIVTG